MAVPFGKNILALAFLIIVWRPVEDDGCVVFSGYFIRLCSVGVAVLDISCAAPFWTDGTLLEKGPKSTSWANLHVKRNTVLWGVGPLYYTVMKLQTYKKLTNQNPDFENRRSGLTNKTLFLR